MRLQGTRATPRRDGPRAMLQMGLQGPQDLRALGWVRPPGAARGTPRASGGSECRRQETRF